MVLLGRTTCRDYHPAHRVLWILHTAMLLIHLISLSNQATIPTNILVLMILPFVDLLEGGSCFLLYLLRPIAGDDLAYHTARHSLRTPRPWAMTKVGRVRVLCSRLSSWLRLVHSIYWGSRGPSLPVLDGTNGDGDDEGYWIKKDEDGGDYVIKNIDIK